MKGTGWRRARCRRADGAGERAWWAALDVRSVRGVIRGIIEVIIEVIMGLGMGLGMGWRTTRGMCSWWG
jgi:hypothetical protein